MTDDPCADFSSGECQEALQELYHYLDGQLTIERRTVIKTHIDLCGHCLSTYAKLFAMVPGVLLPILLELEDGWFVLGGAGATLSLLVGLYLPAPELPRPGLYALQVVVLVAVSVEATLLATLLRM